MDSSDMIIGSSIVAFITGTCFIIYIVFFSNNDFITTIEILRHQKYLAEVITKCTFLNLIPLFLMVIYRKDNIARWILATIVAINIFTLFL